VEAAGVQMSIHKFYDQSVILLDYSSSTDYWSTGGSYTTDVSIDAAVNLIASDQRFIGDGHIIRADYKAYSDASTEVYAGRRARWNGDTFEIVEEPKDVLQRGHHIEWLLRRVQDAG
jgi:hypothetical protein